MSEIVLLVEGATEKAAKDAIKTFLDARCDSAKRDRVRLTAVQTEHLRDGEVLASAERSLRKPGILGVVALMDVKCAGKPRQFADAAQAIDYLRRLGPKDARYRAHAAQYDFEAWLLPFWDDICKRVGRKQARPGAKPEHVDLDHPPSQRLHDLYRRAGRRYNKPIEAQAILRGKDLTVSAAQCPQFKAFLDSLLELAGCPLLA